MTYQFVTREEIEKIKGMASAAGDPNHLIVPLSALLESLKLSERILAEREAYREGWFNAVKSFLKYPKNVEVDATLQKDIDAEAARIVEGK